MNKKRSTITILILMIAASVFATDTTTSITTTKTLNISAFKEGVPDTGVSFVLTNALPTNEEETAGSPLPIVSGSEIDITPYKHEFLSEEVQSTNFDRKLAFSYRLSGKHTGTYKITVTATPFYKNGDQQNSTENTIIDNYMIFDTHLMQVCTASSSFIPAIQNTSNTASDSYWYISHTNTGSNQSNQTSGGVSTHEEHSITETLTIGRNENVTTPDKYWVAKAGVMMSISEMDYNAVEKGVYKCTITVRLENAT